MAFGLSSTGFQIKPLATILAEINSSQLANISPTLNLGAASALGQINAIFASALADLWNLAQAVYSAYDPTAASGAQLASLSLITGTTKRAATFSVAKSCTVNLNAGVTLPAGSVASVTGQPTVTFASANSVTNSGGSPANVAVDFVAQTAGPVLAPSGTLAVIAQAVAGWNSVTNPTDAVPGLPIETDSALRIRRNAQLQQAGSSSAGAIQAGILTALGQAAAGDVVSCTVIANDTNSVDSYGHPPHSFEVIALGAVGGSTNDTALATQIYNLKTAGDQAVGTSTVVINDSMGNPHSIGFTRPTAVPIYFSVTVKKDPITWPGDTAGIAAVQAAVAAYVTANQAVGSTVIIERLKSVPFTVTGVVDVPAATLGTAPSPVGTANVPMTYTQIATLTSGNVVVTVT